MGQCTLVSWARGYVRDHVRGVRGRENDHERGRESDHERGRGDRSGHVRGPVVVAAVAVARKRRRSYHLQGQRGYQHPLSPSRSPRRE